MTETIVVGVDGSPTGLRALKWALAEATRTGAEVRAVIAWTFTPYDLPAVTTTADARQHAERILTATVNAALADTADPPPVRTQAIEGYAPRVLTEAAESAAMLVVGSHGHGALVNALLGSVSAECVHRASRPVVVVPPAERPARRAEPTGPVAAPIY
jgi:nucleotide-binding universal stress UspA family protein